MKKEQIEGAILSLLDQEEQVDLLAAIYFRLDAYHKDEFLRRTLNQ